MRPLLLTGGPAAGKSTVATALARLHQRCARIDVDDIRQLVVGGHAAPWEGAEGSRQQVLGVRNTCSLASAFLDAGFDVVIADVVCKTTNALYRAALPGLRVVHLDIAPADARRRAADRAGQLTPREFESLHRQQQGIAVADERIDVTGLSVDELIERIDWR